MGVEEHIVVMDTVVASKVIVVHRRSIPTGHNVSVGVSHMVHILSSIAEDALKVTTAPVEVGCGIIAFEVIVFRIAYGGVVIIGVRTDEAFHVGAAIVAVAQMFGTKDG